MSDSVPALIYAPLQELVKYAKKRGLSYSQVDVTEALAVVGERDLTRGGGPLHADDLAILKHVATHPTLDRVIRKAYETLPQGAVIEDVKVCIITHNKQFRVWVGAKTYF